MLDKKEPLVSGVREDEIYFALKTLNPNMEFVPLMQSVKRIESVLHPNAQLQTLVGIETTEERQKAVTVACEMACLLLEYFLIKDKHLVDELATILNEELAVKIMSDADKIAMSTLSINRKEAELRED